MNVAGLLLCFLAPVANAEISVQQALNDMIEANVDVRVQKTKTESAEAQVWAARGTFLPTVSLAAQQMNAGGNGYNATESVFPHGQAYAATANWNLFKGGADVASLDAAVFEKTNEHALLDNTYLQAEQKSAQALMDLIENKLAVDVYTEAQKNTHRFFTIAEERFNKSLLPQQEVDKVGLDDANAEAKRADAETQFNVTRAFVQSLLGHADVQLAWPWEKHLNLDDVKDLLNADPQTALQDRPDHKAADAQFETEDARGRSLLRTMFASVDLQYTQAHLVVPGMTGDGWSSLATLTIPLWNGYKDYSSYKTQMETKHAAEHRMQQLDKDIESGVGSAQKNFRIAIQQYHDRLNNLKRAHHILDQDEARFKIGRADANDLNLDLNRVTQAEILSLQGVEQAHIAYMNLLHAFGRRVQ